MEQTNIPIYDEKIVKQAKKEMINDKEIYDISDFFKIFADTVAREIGICWADGCGIELPVIANQ